VFRVKLFLPEVHAMARARPVFPGASGQAACMRRRAGLRRARAARILVVDNEEADRELLVQLLEPWALSCAPPPAATIAWTCWPPATGPT
jgi:hypothetical protein